MDDQTQQWKHPKLRDKRRSIESVEYPYRWCVKHVRIPQVRFCMCKENKRSCKAKRGQLDSKLAVTERPEWLNVFRDRNRMLT